MSVSQFFFTPNRVIDSNGISDGATIEFFVTGTTTPQTVYSDAARTTPLANPLTVAAGAAVPAIYLDPSLTYRVRFKDADGNVITGMDYDPYTGINADGITSFDGNTVAEVINSPYLNLGIVNIRNPAWGAPIDNATDPAAAAANATAINAMLGSGRKHCELDDQIRRVNSTLLFSAPTQLHGCGRQQISLVWNGGDFPIIARANYATANGAGFEDCAVMDMRITDQAAARVNHYAIDLSNAPSCRLIGVHYDGAVGSALTNKYGALLGTRPGSGYSPTTFVARVEQCRFVKSRVTINTTDYDLLANEFWGEDRNYALELGGGGRLLSGQIVPGQVGGVRLFHDLGFALDTLNISGVYFDGSTNALLITGWGIIADSGIGVINPVITGNNFWHLNRGGVFLQKMVGGSLVDNIFQDCDSDDTGTTDGVQEDDIRIVEAIGARIDNIHLRGLDGDVVSNKAPKLAGVARSNNRSPMRVTANASGAATEIGGTAQGSYIDSVFTNTGALVNRPGTFGRNVIIHTTLPTASAMRGAEIIYQIEAGLTVKLWSDGTVWQGGVILLGGSEDLNNLRLWATYRTGNIAGHANAPAGLSGETYIYVSPTASGFTQQIAVDASGVTKSRTQSGGTWGAWA